MKKDIRAYGYDRLKEEMEALGEKPFRAKQVYEWLHVKLADDFDEMTNLSKALREKLKEEYVILPVKMLERQISQIDGTNKFLFQLYDGNVVESVLMRYKHGNSVCISSQAGCRMGCAFCASTIGGLQCPEPLHELLAGDSLFLVQILCQLIQLGAVVGQDADSLFVLGPDQL